MNKAPIEIVDILTQYGGEDLLIQVDILGKMPLHTIITKRYYNNKDWTIAVKRASCLINKGIKLNV